MNILVPDGCLREFLHTKATPKQLKEYLSLCGPSIERVNDVDGETVYDVEITTNRPDSMSILGVAREAAAILPRFGIKATLKLDPYMGDIETRMKPYLKEGSKKLHIETDAMRNPRWVSVVLDKVDVKPSPAWLRKKLELTGIRPLNTIVDITNYFMRSYGQPAHAFDYEQIGKKNGIPTMILRPSKKGEKLTTLDGKTRVLPGGDIVIEDGSGRLIDLAGIMGGENSCIQETTKTIVLFMQTYDPMTIRKSAMALAHRTEAAALFEKGLDAELVMPTILDAIDLMRQLTGAVVAGALRDIYPSPYKPYTVSSNRDKIDAYIGAHLGDKELHAILSPLGFTPTVTANEVKVEVPSYRRDVTIDVDVIEEVARMYGYHNIAATLPDTAPPVVQGDAALRWEEEVKIRLRDWGYTEAYTYSMISEELMDIFGMDKEKAYKISNPLSEEWVYMRPSVTPSLLLAIKNNMNLKGELKLFELSMGYEYVGSGLPKEKPSLVVAWTGDKFSEAKGLSETIFELFGIKFPTAEDNNSKHVRWYTEKHLSLGLYGSLGLVNSEILAALGLKGPVTRVYLDFSLLVQNAAARKSYTPLSKFPPSFEDIALVAPTGTLVGPLIEALKKVHPLITDITLLDTYEDTRTIHVTYLSRDKNLTAEDVKPIRVKLIKAAEIKFGAKLKT